MNNKNMSKRAEIIIKNVNATMLLEGMPLSDFDIDAKDKYFNYVDFLSESELILL